MRHLGGRLLDFQLDALELGRDLALVDGGRGLPGVKAVSDAATGRLGLDLTCCKHRKFLRNKKPCRPS